MSALFKGLATTVIWILFIFGVLRLISGLHAFSSGPETASIENYLDSFCRISSLTIPVVVMKLRQSML
jgi:hypothetical protein